jgi:molybdenum cofactor cytidylyltransferase
MASSGNSGSIFALVMAAGSSSRFGATKLLAELDGRPLVHRALEAAASACGRRTLLVLGHDWRAVWSAAGPPLAFGAFNDRYAQGLGTSIAAGVRAVAHVAQGAIVMLADQPLVTGEHLERLVSAQAGSDRKTVATSFAGSIGPPVLFPRAAFDALLELDGDDGARRLLDDPRFELDCVAFEPAAVDVDTPADLRRISRSARS